MVLRDRKFLDALCRLQITPTQFYLMYLLHTRKYADISTYHEKVGEFPVREVDDLIDRGLVIDMNKPGEPIYADLLSLTDAAQTLMFVATQECGEDLWTSYPSFIIVNGSNVPAKTCDKDEIMDLYGDVIAYNPVLHRRVMEVIDYAKRNGLITMGIEKWVKSRQWETVEELMSAEGGDEERYGEREL